MKEHRIIELALENLHKNTGIIGKWKERRCIDGELTLKVDHNTLRYFALVKREVRPHQLEQLFRYKKQFEEVILVAERIFPRVKKELREIKFPYLEANGNLFIPKDQLLVWIDTNRPITPKKDTGNRAFTRTGLKVLFQFFLDKNLVNLPQREIAEKTGVALGNIPQVIDGLKETGYLLKLDKKKYIWDRKKELMDRWITEYDTRLKPNLLQGRYKLAVDWKNIQLDTKRTVWGGEPAGDLLTNYLRPEELTLYTKETKQELIKHYKLMPENNGNLVVYGWFWNQTDRQPTAPPFLVYTDLKIKNNKRCRETAEMIFNEYIQPNL